MQHLPQLSKPQATVLALWSGAAVTGRQENTLRQRLREWYYEVSAKRGSQRQALPVETCFAPLLGWIVSRWQGTQLALDATTLEDRFVGLAVSVVYRDCAIPVAWGLLPAG
jgi:hypothetical protein